MLRVARIAQSVEQGIENPRVLGSIPSPGTIFREPSLWLGFCFSRTGLSIELRSIIRSEDLTLRASAKALFNTAPAPVVRVRAPYLENPAYGWVFAFQGLDSPSNCVRLFGLKTSPCGPALKRHRIIRWMCNFALQVHFLERPTPQSPTTQASNERTPILRLSSVFYCHSVMEYSHEPITVSLC